ncbi:TetR/AcrR family transcriptional regulator [Arcanobacterium hippocoleae]|uniref:TetR/AcrR family transcriptional regulator n=1 Tax=Arcanobacterium hippocoleae TaxID=149017 RepID=UPI00333EAB94
MPKISAATVKEHHEQMFNKLVDAAEKILRESGPGALTAGSVAKAAGIARNSIYRYVGSIDDLRLVVLERYLPLWVNSVEKRVNRSDDPRKQVLDLALASLEMAQTTGHSWLISVMRHRGECAEKILMRQVRMHRTTGKAR